MKNKNIFLGIAFGLAVIFAGRYAYAESALSQLKDAANASSSGGNPSPGAVSERQPPAAGSAAKVESQKTPPEISKSTDTAKPDEKDKKNPVMEFLGKHKTEIFVGALGGYLGFALMGPAGIVAGVLCALGIAFLANA